MSVNPREAAIKALYKIEKDGAYLNKAVLEASHGCEPRDRALVNELVSGVYRNRLRLDFIICSYSKIRLKKLSVWVLCILRSGVYQLVMMDKIPPSAACNEAVKLAAKYAHSSAKGYVNGVLRTVSRNLEALPEPGKDNKIEYLSVMYSCPEWLTQKLFKQFGEDKCTEILRGSLKPQPASIRINTLKTDAKQLAEMLRTEGTEAEQDLDVPQCMHIRGAIDVYNSAAYSEGYYTLQNINSMRAALALNPKSGDTVIDVCAAPGGKTTHIAELMGDKGKVIAFDVHPHKIELIENAAKRLGLSCISAREHNSETAIAELRGMADGVLADVPCSGIGVIGKKPDIKWNRKPDDVVILCEIQRNILSAAAEYVKPGGILVYSTCTILSEENEEQTERFLREHSDFKKDFEKLYIAEETGGSGFYICRFRRMPL